MKPQQRNDYRSFSTTGTVRSPSRSDRVSGRVRGKFWVFQKRKWLIGWSWVGPNFLKKRSISRLEVFQKLARCAVGQKLVWVAQFFSVLSKIWSGNGQVDQKGQTFPKLVHPESFDFDLKLELQTCRGYLSFFCFWLVESKFSDIRSDLLLARTSGPVAQNRLIWSRKMQDTWLRKSCFIVKFTTS